MNFLKKVILRGDFLENILVIIGVLLLSNLILDVYITNNFKSLTDKLYVNQCVNFSILIFTFNCCNRFKSSVGKKMMYYKWFKYIIIVLIIFKLINTIYVCYNISNIKVEKLLFSLTGCYMLFEIFSLVCYVILGVSFSDKMVKERIYYISVHEAGHAVVWMTFMSSNQIKEIFVGPCYGAVSLTVDIYSQVDDKFSVACMCYAGKIAVEKLLKKASIGDEYDLKKVYKLSNIIAGTPEGAEEIRRKAYDVAENIIDARKDDIMKLANVLAKKGKLNSEEIREFYNNYLKN